jgi:hypothetical protein
MFCMQWTTQNRIDREMFGKSTFFLFIFGDVHKLHIFTEKLSTIKSFDA